LVRAHRLAVEVEIREATPPDLRTLSTWSGNVDGVFRPAIESGRGILLVASAGGRFPIGHALIDLKTRRSESIGVLSHLQVLGGFRDQGLGTALMEEGERRMHDAGLTTALLAVEKVNAPAERLYERRGYKRVGEAVDRWPEPGPDGELRDVDHPSWLMQRKLR
jgi:ribosomal protein S18 acetylase RimI-like enzyme